MALPVAWWRVDGSAPASMTFDRVRIPARCAWSAAVEFTPHSSAVYRATVKTLWNTTHSDEKTRLQPHRWQLPITTNNYKRETKKFTVKKNSIERKWLDLIIANWKSWNSYILLEILLNYLVYWWIVPYNIWNFNGMVSISFLLQ